MPRPVPQHPHMNTARPVRIRQSIVSWPFQQFGEQWDLDTLCRTARDLGAESVELVDPDGWPTLQRHGLSCAIAPNGMPGQPFVKGLNNPAWHEEVIARTRNVIEAAAQSPVPVHAVIAFTGFSGIDPADPAAGTLSPEEGARNTIDGLRKLDAIARPHGIEIHVEHLNTRVRDDDNRGHPGYQGDHIDYCADIIRAVGSPRVKLLFDFYHVQLMDGDLIRRVREYGPELIGHVHTAGIPGRGELDESQEIQFPAVIRALRETGYRGFVGHEFIPTRNPTDGLAEAIRACGG